MSRSEFFVKCLNATIPLHVTCTLANEYPSSNEISKKNGTVPLEKKTKFFLLFWPSHLSTDFNITSHKCLG